MSSSAKTAPVFVGGTVAEHVMFMVSMCRFQHISLPLCWLHFATWSIVHTSLFVITTKLFGVHGAIAYGALLLAWALAMDVGIGLLFGLLEFGYACLAFQVVSLNALPAGTSGVVGIAVACIVIASVTEAVLHLLFQGYPPRPPALRLLGVPAPVQPLVGLYFVIFFGLFFMTLDLFMRLVGYRSEQHRDANEISNDWHRVAAGEAETAARVREHGWHLRAIAAQSTEPKP